MMDWYPPMLLDEEESQLPLLPYSGTGQFSRFGDISNAIMPMYQTRLESLQEDLIAQGEKIRTPLQVPVVNDSESWGMAIGSLLPMALGAFGGETGAQAGLAASSAVIPYVQDTLQAKQNALINQQRQQQQIDAEIYGNTLRQMQDTQDAMIEIPYKAAMEDARFQGYLDMAGARRGLGRDTGTTSDSSTEVQQQFYKDPESSGEGLTDEKGNTPVVANGMTRANTDRARRQQNRVFQVGNKKFQLFEPYGITDEEFKRREIQITAKDAVMSKLKILGAHIEQFGVLTGADVLNKEQGTIQDSLRNEIQLYKKKAAELGASLTVNEEKFINRMLEQPGLVATYLRPKIKEQMLTQISMGLQDMEQTSERELSQSGFRQVFSSKERESRKAGLPVSSGPVRIPSQTTKVGIAERANQIEQEKANYSSGKASILSKYTW